MHIFGNTSSPAVATICLREASNYPDGILQKLENHPISETGKSIMLAREYVRKSFYVDDGVGSADNPEEAVSVLHTARSLLSNFNIRLHKIVSNCSQVMNAFPSSERAEVPAEVEFGLPTQQTLGVAWSIDKDLFIMKVNCEEKPFSKRCILSLVNSIFDPIGIACPVILGGKLIQRRILSQSRDDSIKLDWDDPLPDSFYKTWKSWVSALCNLDLLEIPRCFIPANFGKVKKQTSRIYRRFRRCYRPRNVFKVY